MLLILVHQFPPTSLQSVHSDQVAKSVTSNSGSTSSSVAESVESGNVRGSDSEQASNGVNGNGTELSKSPNIVKQEVNFKLFKLL